MLVKKVKYVFIILVLVITTIHYNHLTEKGLIGTERRLNLFVVMAPICVVLGIGLLVLEKLEKQRRRTKRKNKRK